MKSLIALLLFTALSSSSLFGIEAAEDLEAGTITISPSSPNASWPPAGTSNSLAPNYTASITVDVKEEEDGYSLYTGPDPELKPNDPNLILTVNGNKYSFTNTAADAVTVTLTVKCKWKKSAGGDGGGGATDDIKDGTAEAEFELLDSVVDWDFDRTHQWFGDDYEIGFKVTVTDSNGFGLENWDLVAFSATDATPQDPNWAIIPKAIVVGAPNWTLDASAWSDSPSKGKIKFEYNDGSEEERISNTEIAFIKLILLKVGFEGTGNRTIRSDDGATNYTTPHWSDPNGDGDPTDGHSYPVAYHSDSKLTIKPEWELVPEVNGVELKIKASGTANTSIAEVNAEVNGSNVDLLNAAESTEVFEEHKVRYWNEFELNFEASFQGENEWVDTGTSINQLYVTREAPNVFPLFHTVVHIGCMNANDEEDPGKIVTTIWNEFSDRVVRRVNTLDAMQYWGANAQGNADTASLLAVGDAQCGGWARFFRDCLAAQRIDSVYSEIKPHVSHDFGMGKVWAIGFRVDPNIPGQGPAAPAHHFSDHAVIKHDGTIYDPSYGVSYASEIAWENASLTHFLYDNTPTPQTTADVKDVQETKFTP